MMHGANYQRVRDGIRTRAKRLARQFPHVVTYGGSLYKRGDYQSCFDSAFQHERRLMADEAAMRGKVTP